MTFAPTTANVGQTISYSIAQFDTQGLPMAQAAPYDSPPVWSNSNPAVETITASADGTTASAVATGAGSDTVTLTVVSGGVTFTATDSVVVSQPGPPPQVLGSVGIVAAVS